MAVNFKMVGKLQMPKETEKFHPYMEKVSESGWMIKRLRLNVISGTNRHTISLHDLYKADGTGTIYSRKNASSTGEFKTESFQIPYKDRLKPEVISEVAELSKFVLDLNPKGRLSKLNLLNKAVKDGSGITDEQLKEVGLTDASQIENAYANAVSKRMEFVTPGDLIDAIRKVVENDTYSDTIFYIRGHIEYSYSSDGRIYEEYVPNKFYVSDGSEALISTATYKLLFGKDSLEDNELNCYHFERNVGYNKNRDPENLKNIPVSTTIVIPKPSENADEKEKKRFDLLKKKFTVTDDKWFEVGCEVELIDGSPRKSISYDDLDDDQKETVDLGLMTLDEIRAEMGGSVYGEYVRENRFLKYSRGYSRGPEATAYTDDDFVIKTGSDEEETDLDDLFGDL